MDSNDEMIYEVLAKALVELHRGLGLNELRSDSEAHESLVSQGFTFPKGWVFGGGSAEVHLHHLEESGKVFVREVSKRGGLQKQYLARLPLRGYVRMFSHQEVEIPTVAIEHVAPKWIQIEQLYGDDVRHDAGTPSISTGPMKIGAPTILRRGYHRFEVPGISVLFGSPIAIWRHANTRPLGLAKLDDTTLK